MDNDNIKIFRLWSGEMIIGKEVKHADLSSWTPAGYEIEDPRSVVMIPTARGDVHVMMKPVCAPFIVERLKKSMTVPFAQVMFVLDSSEIDKEMLNGYKSEISGIKIASVSDTMAINSGNGQSGEFVL